MFVCLSLWSFNKLVNYVGMGSITVQTLKAAQVQIENLYMYLKVDRYCREYLIELFVV